MTVASSPLLMFRQLIVLLCAAAGLTGLALAGLFHLGMESVAPAYGIAALVLAGCVFHVAVKGRVRVEITQEYVAVSRPFKEELRFSRNSAVFSSRVVSHSVNLIPVETERILIVHEGEEPREILLANLSKKSFDSLMADLLKDKVRQEAVESEEEEAGEELFAVPKVGMLGDFRRLMAIFIILGVVLSVGFGVPVVMTYKKRTRDIPENVAISGGDLEIGEEYFPLAAIRRIVVTPPDYAAGNFVDNRTVAVWTDNGKTVFNFGKRNRGGVWKTVFEEYAPMCGALERAAARSGVEFVYDL